MTITAVPPLRHSSITAGKVSPRSASATAELLRSSSVAPVRLPLIGNHPGPPDRCRCHTAVALPAHRHLAAYGWRTGQLGREHPATPCKAPACIPDWSPTPGCRPAPGLGRPPFLVLARKTTDRATHRANAAAPALGHSSLPPEHPVAYIPCLAPCSPRLGLLPRLSSPPGPAPRPPGPLAWAHPPHEQAEPASGHTLPRPGTCQSLDSLGPLHHGRGPERADVRYPPSPRPPPASAWLGHPSPLPCPAGHRSRRA